MQSTAGKLDKLRRRMYIQSKSYDELAKDGEEQGGDAGIYSCHSTGIE